MDIGERMPEMITGVHLWEKYPYTPVGGGLVDGDPVSSWADSSGAGHTATQTGSVRPTFKTAIVNGKPVVRYAGSQTMVVPAISSIWSWSAITVMKPTATLSEFSSLNSSGSNVAFHHTNGVTEFVFITDRDGYKYIVAPTASAFHAFTSVAASSGTFNLWIDGTFQALTAGSSPTTNDFVQLGNGDGDIAEVMIFNTVLGTTDWQNLMAYVGVKFAITIGGTGAGGTPVQPNTVAGLVGWWKADSLL